MTTTVTTYSRCQHAACTPEMSPHCPSFPWRSAVDSGHPCARSWTAEPRAAARWTVASTARHWTRSVSGQTRAQDTASTTTSNWTRDRQYDIQNGVYYRMRRSRRRRNRWLHGIYSDTGLTNSTATLVLTCPPPRPVDLQNKCTPTSPQTHTHENVAVDVDLHKGHSHRAFQLARVTCAPQPNNNNNNTQRHGADIHTRYRHTEMHNATAGSRDVRVLRPSSSSIRALHRTDTSAHEDESSQRTGTTLSFERQYNSAVRTAPGVGGCDETRHDSSTWQALAALLSIDCPA